MNYRAFIDPFYAWRRIKYHGAKRLLLNLVKRRPKAQSAMRRLIQGTLMAIHPLEYSERRSLRKRMLANSRWQGFVVDNNGYAVTDVSKLPGADRVLQICQDLYRDWAANNRQSNGANGGAHAELNYVELLSKKSADPARKLIADLTDHPEIQQFVLGRDMAEIAADYLGEVPVVATVQLTLTTPNDSRVGPQKFHLDYGAPRELQLFMAITDIDEATGPLSFFPASMSERLLANTDFAYARLEDEDVYSIVPQQELIRGTGKAGTCLFIDTARCAHYGSRGNLKNRAVLIVKYISRFSSSDHNNSLGLIRFDRSSLHDRYQRLLVDI